MKLDIQIISILYYFAFGIFYSFCFNLFYRYFFYSSRFILFITNFVFMLIMFFIYAISNTIINQGVIHIYFLLVFMLSFFLGNYIFKSIRCKI